MRLSRQIPALAAAIALGLAGCGESDVERGVDEAGREAEETGEDAKRDAEKAGEDAKRDAEDAADDVEREAEK